MKETDIKRKESEKGEKNEKEWKFFKNQKKSKKSEKGYNQNPKVNPITVRHT